MKKLLTLLFIVSSVFCCTHAAFAAEPTVYEFEDYEQTANKIKTNEQASGGKYVQISERTKNTEHSVTIPFEAKEGEYILEFIASEESANSANSAGPMYFLLDDGEEVKVTASTCTVTAITPTYPSDTFKMSKIKYKTNLVLSEGEHEIKVILRANAETEKTKGALDCMLLTKDGDDYPAVTDGAILLEAENAAASNYIEDAEQARGGKVCKIMYTTTEQILEFKFTSEDAINVNMEIAAAEEAFVGTHLSPIYFTLNSDSEVKIGSGNTTNAGDLFSCEFPLKQLRYKTELSLKKGINTLTLRIPKRSTFNQDFVFCVIDCISLRKVKEIRELTPDIAGTVKRGEMIPLKFKNQDGEGVAVEDLDSAEVSFENDYIGEFSDGAAYARNYGKTTMNITAKKGSGTFTLSVPIEVISETGLSIEEAKKDGNKISLKLKANGSYSGGERVFIASYNNKDGMLTSVVELISEVLQQANDGEIISVEKELSAAASTVYVFIVSADDSESTVYQKVTL